MTQKPTSWINQTLGERYHIESLLGRGGMSSVYRATDNNLKRAVAVKIIHPQLTEQPEFVQQFEQEATAVAQLRHQNIVRVYDFRRDQGIYYMVLEYIPGETLAEKLAALNKASMRLPLTESVRIAINLCDAIDYAHQRRMIHRDIKPQNIMINLLGEPILMDFGIAKLVGQPINNLGDEAALGSALYMSPEQVQGKPVDFRTDIYALGVVLYEMISGYPPFRGQTTTEIMTQQIEANPPDLHLLNPNLPQTLIAIVERALQKLPERRYQAASEMTTTLQSVVLTLQNPLETLGSRHLEHLTRLWLQASEAFDELNYIGCIEKIDELTRTGADYQTEQSAQLREEAVKRLYEQALSFFQMGQFGEALVVITALRDLTPDYPNLSHLESQVRQSVQSNTIQSDLDALYEEAVAALESSEYALALEKWEMIENQRGSLPYRDRMNVESRAKVGICAVLYNNAFLAVSDHQPYIAMDYWQQIKAIDPDFPDEDGVLELAERMFNTEKDVKRRDKRLLVGALIVGVLAILSAIGWRIANPNAGMAAGVVPLTPTAVTPTRQSTESLVILEPTATEISTKTPSATPSATPTLAPTATPAPTDSPAGSPMPDQPNTPGNIGLVLDNVSIFAIPDLGGEELAVVETGDTITILGRSEDGKWFFVGDGETAGFVFGERVQWRGDSESLPVFTHSNAADSAPKNTPIPAADLTELTFDLWELPETAVCTTTGWEQDIFFAGHGGNGVYAYYWNSNLIKGPTNSSTIFRLVSTGGDIVGLGKVESGGGRWVEKPLVIAAPNCE